MSTTGIAYLLSLTVQAPMDYVWGRKATTTGREIVAHLVIPAKPREAGTSRDPEHIDFPCISWIPDRAHLW